MIRLGNIADTWTQGAAMMRLSKSQRARREEPETNLSLLRMRHLQDKRNGSEDEMHTFMLQLQDKLLHSSCTDLYTAYC